MDKKLKPLIFLIGVNLFFSCQEESSNRTPKVNVLPDQVVENTTITFTHSGVKTAEIKVRYLEKYEKRDMAKGREIFANIYNEEGEHISILKADSGWIRERKQEIKVFGDVVVKSDKGMVLETQSLSWNPLSNIVTTEDFVKITKGEDVITGYGLEADQELKELRIKKEIKGKIKEVMKEDLK
ncbi:MAG: LPS export ABC transporter periplasmic protein LptC [candidate division Zixibacteria bacterium]|nr:LPS export ABC transporter periplasmic protein LptC [candidate division Zixibacteria bacterium]